MATNQTGTETDDIEKIMSEIEELQKEMAPQSAVTQMASPVEEKSEQDILSEIQASATPDEGGLEETLSKLKQEEANGGVLAAATRHVGVEEETEPSMSHSNSDGTLSLTLTGNMTLRLKYEFEGQDVTISFVDQSLKVQMSDGTEFKVPVRSSQTTATSNVKPFKKAV